MDDDDRLLDALGRALVPPAEPPPGRLNAFLAGVGRERHQSRVTPPRLGWLAAGVSVMAALVVLLVLALPTLLSPPDTPPAEVAVARLRTALAGGDPIAVAEADANLLRVTRGLPDREARQVRNEAVSAHTQAVAFLRDNPAPVEFAPRAVDRAAPAPGGAPAPAPPASPPPAAAPPPGVRATTTTTVAPSVLGVDILSVTAELDGSFRVDFTTSGFTPDPRRAPGTHAVHFSFDGGERPTLWTGPAPWVFPLDLGILHRQVCAEVVDHNGVADPSTRRCRPIG